MNKEYTVLRDCWLNQQKFRKGSTVSLSDSQARWPLKEGKIARLKSDPAPTKKTSKK